MWGKGVGCCRLAAHAAASQRRVPFGRISARALGRLVKDGAGVQRTRRIDQDRAAAD
jgi:hypothetical protein